MISFKEEQPRTTLIPRAKALALKFEHCDENSYDESPIPESRHF